MKISIPLLKNIALWVCFLISFGVFGQSTKINPTGTYTLGTEVKNGDTYGRFGNIKVKQIDSSKIVILLFVCRGAPSYNQGFAYDTLVIKNNVAIYTTETDTSCKVIFNFHKDGIKVEERTNDYNMGCGFGHAVMADGFYKRKSNKIPTDEELNEH